MSLKMRTMKSTKDCSEKIEQMREKIKNYDTVVIGAGAGLSAAIGACFVQIAKMTKNKWPNHRKINGQSAENSL